MVVVGVVTTPTECVFLLCRFSCVRFRYSGQDSTFPSVTNNAALSTTDELSVKTKVCVWGVDGCVVVGGWMCVGGCVCVGGIGGGGWMCVCGGGGGCVCVCGCVWGALVVQLVESQAYNPEDTGLNPGVGGDKHPKYSSLPLL